MIKKIQFSVTIKKEIVERFKAKCKAEQRCYSKVIEMLMEKYTKEPKC